MENYRPDENNFNFKMLLKNDQNSENPIWQQVLDGLREGNRGWKRVSHDIKGCRHPGVKDAGNRCIFCVLEQKSQRDEMQEITSERAKETYIENLLKQATDMENKVALMRLEAFQLRGGGGVWPPAGVSLISRKKAVELGLKWYMPVTPCKDCGTLAERYVANGRCRNCRG